MGPCNINYIIHTDTLILLGRGNVYGEFFLCPYIGRSLISWQEFILSLISSSIDSCTYMYASVLFHPNNFYLKCKLHIP